MADIAPDAAALSVLDAAQRGDSKELAQLLASHHDDDLPNARDSQRRMPALHWACASDEHKCVHAFLDDPRTDVTATAAHGMTAIHICASSNAPASLSLLLDSKALSVDCRNEWDETALHVAATSEAKSVCPYCLPRVHRRAHATSGDGPRELLRVNRAVSTSDCLLTKRVRRPLLLRSMSRMQMLNFDGRWKPCCERIWPVRWSCDSKGVRQRTPLSVVFLHRLPLRRLLTLRRLQCHHKRRRRHRRRRRRLHLRLRHPRPQAPLRLLVELKMIYWPP